MHQEPIQAAVSLTIFSARALNKKSNMDVRHVTKEIAPGTRAELVLAFTDRRTMAGGGQHANSLWEQKYRVHSKSFRVQESDKRKLEKQMTNE